MPTLTRSRGAAVVLKRGVSYLPRKPNYYEILGVGQNATQEEIRSAFVKKSHELHPDRRTPSQDRRKGWKRSSDTESFMELRHLFLQKCIIETFALYVVVYLFTFSVVASQVFEFLTNLSGQRNPSTVTDGMKVKEAYDCLRKPANRATYDNRLINAAGYLREASHLKYKQGTIIGLNANRNEVYNGPRGLRSPVSSHFRDLEQEYYKEKYKNRMLVVLAGLAFMLILANIGYVSYLRRTRHPRFSENLAADKES